VSAGVFVVVVSDHDVAGIERLIAQLERQTVRPDVVVVDNAASERAQGAPPRRFAARGLSVRVVEPPYDRGFAGGANDGLEEALRCGAETVVLLGTDVDIDDRLLERCSDALAATGTDVLAPVADEDGPGPSSPAGGSFSRRTGRTASGGFEHRAAGAARPGIVVPCDWASGRCLALRARTATRLGPLDETLFLSAVVVDWELRTRARAGVLLEALLSQRDRRALDERDQQLDAAFRTRNLARLALRHGRSWAPLWLLRLAAHELAPALARRQWWRLRADLVGLGAVLAPPERLLSQRQPSVRPFVAVYSPTIVGGHPLYVQRLGTALKRDYGYELVQVTSRDFPLTGGHPGWHVARVTRPLRAREAYRSKLTWFLRRAVHYTLRDLTFARWVAAHRADVSVVHLQEWSPWMLSHLARTFHRLGIPVVATVHNVRPHGSSNDRKSLREWVDHRGLRNLDGIFVHTGLDLTDTARRLGVPRASLHPVEHGLLAEPVPPEPAAERRAVFFGNWRPNKGIPELLQAARLLEGWQIVVAGSSEDPQYTAYCRSLAGANVTLREGFIPDEDIPSVFAGARVCVLPYQQLDAQSGVLHLAIAFGLPVVVTPVGGMAPIVEEFDCGVVAKACDPSSIADAVRAFDDDRLVREKCDGVQRVQKVLDWSEAARATAALYRVVGDGRSGGAPSI
jgi:glycosyltransferase involved in cell wall biosynthesis/GT2 family glycosyltransferase